MSAKVLLISFNLSFIKLSAEVVEIEVVDNSVVTVTSSLSSTFKKYLLNQIFYLISYCYIRVLQFYYQVLQFSLFIIDHFYEVGHQMRGFISFLCLIVHSDNVNVGLKLPDKVLIMLGGGIITIQKMFVVHRHLIKNVKDRVKSFIFRCGCGFFQC